MIRYKAKAESLIRAEKTAKMAMENRKLDNQQEHNFRSGGQSSFDMTHRYSSAGDRAKGSMNSLYDSKVFSDNLESMYESIGGTFAEQDTNLPHIAMTSGVNETT